MALDINERISYFIENQFPSIYKEDGPTFIAFLKAYYEFLETDEDMAVYRSRRLLDYRDIDKTLDAFISKFTETYLDDFPQITATDKRFMIKHIMDYYRSKGSNQSLELFMRLVYGEEVNVYFPGQDVLQVSNSLWYLPIYIELNETEGVQSLLDKQITGSITGSTAFVEGIVRKRTRNGEFITVAYLSQVKGTFVTGELISSGGDFTNAPKIIGSLSSIEILSGGSDNSVGDIYDVVSNFGVQGQVRVSEIDESTTQGVVEFELTDGGFGYTADSNTTVYVSEGRFIAEVGTQNVVSTSTIIQNLETIDISNGDVSAVTFGRPIEATGVANGIVAEVVSNTSLIVNVLSGSFLNANTGDSLIYSIDEGGNTEILELGNAVSSSVNAIVVGSNATSIGLSSNTAPFKIWGVDGAVADVVAGVPLEAPTGSEKYYPQVTVIQASGNLTVNAVGVNFADTPASFQIGSIDDTEVASFIDYSVDPQANIALDSSDFQFDANVAPGNTSGDINTPLADVFANSTQTIGEIQTLVGLNPGSGYTFNPFIYIVNETIADYRLLDEILEIQNITRGYAVDEIVSLTNSSNNTTYGQVTFANNSHVYVQRFSFNYEFEEGNKLIGQTSGAEADVVKRWIYHRQDEVMGDNAEITASTRTSTGVVKTVQIINSGYGYIDLESVSLDTGSNSNIITGTARVEQQGVGLGYWKTRNSHLNSEKRIHDNEYYQEYSYDIQSGISLNKYRDAVLELVHVAGTKLFGSVVIDSCVGLETAICNSYIDIANSGSDFIQDDIETQISETNHYIVINEV